MPRRVPSIKSRCRKMEAAGYGTTLMVLDASLCGVPEKRKRLILIGELGGQTDALAPFLTASLAETRMTVRDHLGKSLGLEHYYRHPRNYNRRGIYSIDRLSNSPWSEPASSERLPWTSLGHCSRN